jgi:hypothetical protein
MSHSGADRLWVEWLAEQAGQIGIQVYLFEHDPQPGTYISEKIKQSISAADAVVVLMTSNSVQSAYVQQEIGFAEAQRKLIVPLVQPGVDHEITLNEVERRRHLPYQFEPDFTRTNLPPRLSWVVDQMTSPSLSTRRTVATASCLRSSVRCDSLSPMPIPPY